MSELPNFDMGNKNLEREKGIEPSTYSLGSCRSTTELLPPCLLSIVGRVEKASPVSWAAAGHADTGWKCFDSLSPCP